MEDTAPEEPLGFRLQGQAGERYGFVLHALRMARELPPYAADDPDPASLPNIVRVACLEAFFVNVRLLAEFLARKPKQRYITARDFVEGWSPEASTREGVGPFGDRDVRSAAMRLRDVWWALASAHVVHLGDDRLVPDRQEPTFEDTSRAGLRAIVADIDVVWRAFELASGLIAPGEGD